jgi:hypothetical protein
MSPHPSRVPTLKLLSILLVPWMVIPALVLAGPSQPGRRGGGDAKRPPTPAKTEQASSAELDGSMKGCIQRFTPSKDAADEDLLGYLTFKPLDRRTKPIKLAVRKTDDVKIGLPNHSFAPEEASEYLYKGLFCTVTWQPNRDPKSKSVKRELKDLVMDTLDIEGKIDQLADDSIIIRGRPKEGDWPIVESDAPTKASASASKLATQKKIKLKVIQDLTQYTDPSDTPLEASQFEAGQSIDATIVYGKSQGIIVSLRTPGPRTAKAIAPEAGRGAPPPPPRGGGGRRPVGGG